MGCVRLGSARGIGSVNADVRLVHQAIDAGVTVFDTADAYGAGNSERTLGKALAGRRSTVRVATKVGYRFSERSPLAQRVRTVAQPLASRLKPHTPSSDYVTPSSSVVAHQDFRPEYLRCAIEKSLDRLGTDYIDVLQLHAPRTVGSDVVELAQALIAEGKIVEFGVGAESLDQATMLLDCGAVTTIQIPFGVLDPQASASVLPRARQGNISVWARGVLGGGLLALSVERRIQLEHDAKWPAIKELLDLADESGISIFQLAVDYVRARPEVDVVLIGIGSSSHLERGVQMMATPVTDSRVIARIDAILGRQGWIDEST